MHRLLLLLFLAACGRIGQEWDLSELVVQDSTYFDPVTMLPFTGHVFRNFEDDSTTAELRGELLDGTWNGELTVYHPNGRIRYMGSLSVGAQCGAWIENRDPEPPGDVFAELKQEIESMGLYPPCPDEMKQ
jgi:hypothetical protein